jgi:hypothetical protein
MAMTFGIHNFSWPDGPDPAEAFVAVKAQAPWVEDRGFAGTVSETIDLIGQYQDAGIDSLINVIDGTKSPPANFSPRMSCRILPDEGSVGTPERGSTGAERRRGNVDREPTIGQVNHRTRRISTRSLNWITATAHHSHRPDGSV